MAQMQRSDLMATRSLPAWTRAVFPIVPQLESYRSGWLLKDVSVGLGIAAVALPIGLAYPAIAGLPPIVGLYASILPLVGSAIFGSSRQLIVGPDAATLTILAASLAQISTAASCKGSLSRPSSQLQSASCVYCRESAGWALSQFFCPGQFWPDISARYLLRC
jgi:MFS superfamily sulfate permease-like transporter